MSALSHKKSPPECSHHASFDVISAISPHIQYAQIDNTVYGARLTDAPPMGKLGAQPSTLP